MEKTFYRILLIDETPTDLIFLENLLENISSVKFEINRANTLREAIKLLDKSIFDIILVELNLPDSRGIQTVQNLRRFSAEIPIIVVTHVEDEEIAFLCIREGIQDYLIKNRINSDSLRLAINYSILRNRNAEIEEFASVSSANLFLSSQSAGGKSEFKTDSIKFQNPGIFEKFVIDYSNLMDLYSGQIGTKSKKLSGEMSRIISLLAGELARSEDLLDIHIAALDQTIGKRDLNQTQKIRKESQFLALKMMGLLANYYRKKIKTLPQ